MANEPASKAVIVFDVGGVLVAHDNNLMFRTLASRCAAPDALAYLTSRNFGLADGKRHISSVHQELARELGYSGDWELFKSDICCHFTLDPSMMEFAARLAETNRLVLFSNTFDVHWDYVLKLHDGALAKFEWYASHLIRDAKPAESAFRKVAQLAAIDPARSIFVDDLAENVAAAQHVGFNAHLFVSQPVLERFLRDVGVAW